MSRVESFVLGGTTYYRIALDAAQYERERAAALYVARVREFERAKSVRDNRALDMTLLYDRFERRCVRILSKQYRRLNRINGLTKRERALRAQLWRACDWPDAYDNPLKFSQREIDRRLPRATPES